MIANNADKDNYIEKRKYPRLHLRIKLDCELSQVSTPSIYALIQFNSKNISSGGVFVEGIKNLPEGQVINLEFSMPEDDKTINVKGLVMWSDNTGSGVRFLTLGIDEFEMISDYVRENMSS